MGVLIKGTLITGRSRTPFSIITLPRGQYCAARLRGCPPLDLSSSRSRGMPPQAFGTTASLRSACPGSAYSLVLALARLRSTRSGRSLPFLPRKKRGVRRIRRSIAELLGVRMSATRHWPSAGGHFGEKWMITIGDVFMGVSCPHRQTDTQQNVARIAHPLLRPTGVG